MPAERPVIRDLVGQRRRQDEAGANLVGPHDEGARLVLECETSGGWPEPALSWWRDGRLVDDSYELVSALDGQLLERRRSSGQGEPSLEESGLESANAASAMQLSGQVIDQQANERQEQEPASQNKAAEELQSQRRRPQQQQQQQLGARLVRNRLMWVGKCPSRDEQSQTSHTCVYQCLKVLLG